MVESGARVGMGGWGASFSSPSCLAHGCGEEGRTEGRKEGRKEVLHNVAGGGTDWAFYAEEELIGGGGSFDMVVRVRIQIQRH